MGRQCNTTRSAFTLLEVLLALSLLVLFAALAWPLMQNQIVAAELPESASRFRSLLYMTRSAAMLEHRRHRVRFTPEGQQPIIEIEPDPIVESGLFVPVDYDWAAEPTLLADIEVHRVHPGRPAYMRPVSAADGEAVDPLAVEEPVVEEVSAVESTSAKLRAAASDGLGGQEAEIDERRPVIMFEADGSTDWATFVLARMPPEEELPEEEPQSWVVLDGRTGLAIIRDAVTQSQLDDPTFYVQREKLELPDLNASEDLTLEMSTEDMPQEGGEESQGMADLAGLAQQAGGQPQDPTKIPGTEGQPPQELPVDPNQLPQEIPTEKDALAQLEDELAKNPELTEEEKDEIRRSFQEGQSKQEEGDTKSPS